LQIFQDATPAAGEVQVCVSSDETTARIQIRDNGAGMTRDFMRERLFRPFDSTKGSQGMGIGVYQARELARNLGGDLTYESQPGSGTSCTLTLPIAQSAM
jgi:signal transduction histidine kinase